MPRYFIERSAVFDSPPYYQANRILGLVREAGGKNARTSLYRGWSNQPKVVTFDAPNQKAADLIGIHVEKRLGGIFRKWGVHSSRKFW